MPDKIASADELNDLEARINALLPPRYVGCFEEVSPASMGSAKLRYDSHGKVIWGEIWTTFCHLALAGGPPHRGRFLGAVSEEEVRASPSEYESVDAELKRALGLCVDLLLLATPPAGWIGLQCGSAATAAWLVRAIIAENVMARHEGAVLFVPAGPHFRVEKEIKNVVVCVAKTCHYLFDHLEPEQQPCGEAPTLIGPPLPYELAAEPARYRQRVAMLRQSLQASTGIPTHESESPGWVGMECKDEGAAVWLLRAVAVGNILARRENATLYVPVDLGADEDRIAATSAVVARAQRLLCLRDANL